jgi:hypothetical protein
MEVVDSWPGIAARKYIADTSDENQWAGVVSGGGTRRKHYQGHPFFHPKYFR